MILQPLVENAIRHGLAGRPRCGWIEVRGLVRGGNLHLEVVDNGPDPGEGLFQAKGHRGRGIGLTNTRDRLHHHYGSGHRFAMDHVSGGTRVNIEIPASEGDSRLARV